MSQFPEEPLNLTSSEGFGYFPAYPGQKLNKDRYEVVRKVGYGSRSSAWLALASQSNERYLVIKILTAHETLQNPPQELKALNAAANQGYINLYDHFDEHSHHGTHLCLVLDVAGPSCEDLRLSSPTKSLSRHIVQRAVACVVDELNKLHKCGLIHGAVTASNIVSDIDIRRESLDPDLAKLPPCTIEKKIAIGEVEYPIVHSHAVPGYVEWNDSWYHVNLNVMNLINLGHAQKMNKRSTPTWEKSRMDNTLRPPEIILGLPFSPKVDIWMLGCAAYHMLTGKPLVPEEKAPDDKTMLSWLIAMSGDRIMPALSRQSNLRAECFDENRLFILGIPEKTLESQIISSGVVPADDIPGIVKFVQKCLTMDPASRPSADDLFGNEWVEPGFAS